MVTIIEGIDSNDINMDELARSLKSKCAAGGTFKEGKIELQGDHKAKVKKALMDMGYRVAA